MTKVLFFDTDKMTLSFLKAHPIADVEAYFFDFDINSSKTQKLCPKDAEIISLFPHSEMVKNEILDFFPRLKLITTRSTGYNHIDLSYTARRKIAVAHVPNYGSTSVAEFTIGMMIALIRRIYPAKSDMKKDAVRMENYIGEDLSGRTLGVIGTGAIGRSVIRLAQAFGMKILAYDPFPTVGLQGVSYVTTGELLKRSDVISLHCPSVPENFHLLDKKAFSQMKKGTYIINTARGNLIETEALYEALRSGKIAGAALDVLENEDILTQREVSFPMSGESRDALADSVINLKIMQLENVIVTPHIAFNSTDAIQRILETTIKNIEGFLSQKPFAKVG